MQTLEKTILKQNAFPIESELSKLETTKEKFIPFLNELQATGFDFTVKDFQDLAYGTTDNLTLWLKERTLEATPKLDKLPITKEAKMGMIALKDYTPLLQSHSAIHADKKKAVYSFAIQDGELVISDAARQQVIDKFTIYGNEDAVSVLKICESIKQLSDKCKTEYGFNPLGNPNVLIHVSANGETSVNIDAINSALERNKV